MSGRQILFSQDYLANKRNRRLGARKEYVFDISLTSYRIEIPRNPENRRKIEISYFFAYFSCIFGLFSPTCRISGFFSSVAGRRDVQYVYPLPWGPADWNNSIAAFGIENFERSIVDWHFRSSPSLCTRTAPQIETPELKYSIQDWNFQSRIEILDQAWIFSIAGPSGFPLPPHFPHFRCFRFESLISKIRPAGFYYDKP